MADEYKPDLVLNNGTPNLGVAYSSPRWDISQERAFKENQIGNRINMLIVFFGIILGSSVNLEGNKKDPLFVLLVGFFIILFVAISIIRTQDKLNKIFDIIRLDKTHPLTVIEASIKPKKSSLNYMSYVIPPAITIVTFSYLLIKLYESPGASKLLGWLWGVAGSICSRVQ